MDWLLTEGSKKRKKKNRIIKGPLRMKSPPPGYNIDSETKSRALKV